MIMIYRRDGDTGGDIEGIDYCGFVKKLCLLYSAISVSGELGSFGSAIQ